jgi:hypothetical protein
VTACGIVVAVIAEDAEEASEVPTEFVAVTVNVYETPDCRPVTVNGDDAPLAVNPLGLEVAVKEVIGAPLSPPEVKETVAAPLLKARAVPTSVAETLTGGLGLPAPANPYPRGLIPREPKIGDIKDSY